MPQPAQIVLEPRKSPVQARSAASVDAILEATIQVLLSVGPDRLTTTRVAKRAGVSVGTLYQYFPNKHSLLFSVLEQHLNRVADAVELACRHHHGEPVSTMVDSVVQAFVDSKMERADISTALYAAAAGREENGGLGARDVLVPPGNSERIAKQFRQGGCRRRGHRERCHRCYRCNGLANRFARTLTALAHDDANVLLNAFQKRIRPLLVRASDSLTYFACAFCASSRC